MSTICAYTDIRQREDLCPICARTRYPELAAGGELLDVVPVYVWGLDQYSECGLSCAHCGERVYTPSGLQPIDDPTIFVPSLDALGVIGEWHNGQSSMCYAVASTGALTINLAAKTYRQAYAMLTDLLRELETARDYPSTSAYDYNALDSAIGEVKDARSQYSR